MSLHRLCCCGGAELPPVKPWGGDTIRGVFYLANGAAGSITEVLPQPAPEKKQFLIKMFGSYVPPSFDCPVGGDYFQCSPVGYSNWTQAPKIRVEMQEYWNGQWVRMQDTAPVIEVRTSMRQRGAYYDANAEQNQNDFVFPSPTWDNGFPPYTQYPMYDYMGYEIYRQQQLPYEIPGVFMQSGGPMDCVTAGWGNKLKVIHSGGGDITQTPCYESASGVVTHAYAHDYQPFDVEQQAWEIAPNHQHYYHNDFYVTAWARTARTRVNFPDRPYTPTPEYGDWVHHAYCRIMPATYYDVSLTLRYD